MIVLAQGIGAGFQDPAASGPLPLVVGECVLVGLISFASPVRGAFGAGYLSYLVGISGADAPVLTTEERTNLPMTIGCVPRGRVTVAAGLFVAGCTVVFALGWTPCLGPTLSGAAAPKAPPQPAECC